MVRLELTTDRPFVSCMVFGKLLASAGLSFLNCRMGVHVAPTAQCCDKDGRTCKFKH